VSQLECRAASRHGGTAKPGQALYRMVQGKPQPYVFR